MLARGLSICDKEGESVRMNTWRERAFSCERDRRDCMSRHARTASS